jgi:hypothetical protein
VEASPLKLFISYRRSDSAHAAQRVRAALQARFGDAAVFIDREIRAGTRWAEQLEQQLEQCTGVVVLVGDAFLRELRQHEKDRQGEPDALAWEIETALKLRKTIYPVLVGAIDMPEPRQLPEAIRAFAGYQAVFAREPAFDAAMTVLLKSIAEEHQWTDPAVAEESRTPRWQTEARTFALLLLGLAAAWTGGRLILWLAGSPERAPEAALWLGLQYSFATALWGLGPYLAYRAVAELRARSRLPVYNLHGLLTCVNLALALVAGGTFVLLTARPGWALRLLWLLPEQPQPWHYALQGAVLLAIVFAALGVTWLEPRVRQFEGLSRHLGMAGLNTAALAAMAGVLWFIASLAASLPPLGGLDPVPLIGWAMQTPALSALVGAWDYARGKLGFSGRSWRSVALFALAVGLFTMCTTVYFARGPMRLLMGAAT